VKNQAGDDYTVLTGNQLGCLLLDYIVTHSESEALTNARMLKTIVTTELGRAIADASGVETVDVLTGFKFIAEKIGEYDTTGEKFVFGFEESYGYLISTFARDKDAVQAAVMAAEMADYWKKQGKTLLDALEVLYNKYGYYLEGLSSLTLKGRNGSRKIAAVMEAFRTNPLKEIAGIKVEKAEDYLAGKRMVLDDSDQTEQISLPKENVLKFILEEDSWVCLRPSGTEPKIKCYYGVRGESEAKSKERLAALQQTMDQLMDEIIQVN
jgi:phosphoglucomutase